MSALFSDVFGFDLEHPFSLVVDTPGDFSHSDNGGEFAVFPLPMPTPKKHIVRELPGLATEQIPGIGEVTVLGSPLPLAGEDNRGRSLQDTDSDTNSDSEILDKFVQDSQTPVTSLQQELQHSEAMGEVAVGAMQAFEQARQAQTLPDLTAEVLALPHMQIGYQFTSKYLNNHGTLCTIIDRDPIDNKLAVLTQMPMKDYQGAPMVSEQHDYEWNLVHYHWGVEKGEYVPAHVDSEVVVKLASLLDSATLSEEHLVTRYLRSILTELIHDAVGSVPEVFVMPKVLPDMLPYDTSLPASIRAGQRFRRPLHRDETGKPQFYIHYTVTHVYELTNTVLYKADSQPQPQAFKLDALKSLFAQHMFEFVDMVEYAKQQLLVNVQALAGPGVTPVFGGQEVALDKSGKTTPYLPTLEQQAEDAEFMRDLNTSFNL